MLTVTSEERSLQGWPKRPKSVPNVNSNVRLVLYVWNVPNVQYVLVLLVVYTFVSLNQTQVLFV